MSNLYQHLRAAMQQGHAPILRWDECDIATADVIAEVGRYAAALRHLGIAPGERIAVQVEKSYENVVLYLAVLQIGAVYLPLNSAYTAAEVSYFLADAAPALFVCAPDRFAELTAVAQTSGVPRIFTLGSSADGTLADVARGQASFDAIESRKDSDLAVICYTSGTTGRSKGAMITHGNLRTNAEVLVREWGFTSRDVLLHALPLYHIHGLFVALHCALLSGARVLLEPRFDATAVLAVLPSVTVMMGVPTYYTRLLSESALDRSAVSNVRLFISGSAPLLAETFHRFEQRTGHRILERYGMTETGMIASNPVQGERRVGSVGRPLPGLLVRVTDDSGAPVAPEVIGTVEVRGPSVFAGYWNMPEKTAAEFRDGFFFTGDLGYFDGDGYLHLVGRSKDLIISGGLNVYPKEIESAIDALDEIVESAVFAIPHPDFGEAVAAAVTPAPHSTVTADEIVAQLRPQLAGFKVPKRVFVVSELPRNAMGKVQKALLREQYAKEFAPPVP